MRRLRVYLDTSVLNFLFAEDVPEQRSLTVEFFDRFVAAGRFLTFISPVVLDEIGRTTNADRRRDLLDVARRYPIGHLPVASRRDEIAALADVYVARRLIPRRKYDDALHVAVCTVHEVDVLASWNFQHLANVAKERGVTVANQTMGYYYPLRLTTPLELMNDES